MVPSRRPDRYSTIICVVGVCFDTLWKGNRGAEREMEISFFKTWETILVDLPHKRGSCCELDRSSIFASLLSPSSLFLFIHCCLELPKSWPVTVEKGELLPPCPPEFCSSHSRNIKWIIHVHITYILTRFSLSLLKHYYLQFDHILVPPIAVINVFGLGKETVKR